MRSTLIGLTLLLASTALAAPPPIRPGDAGAFVRLAQRAIGRDDGKPADAEFIGALELRAVELGFLLPLTRQTVVALIKIQHDDRHLALAEYLDTGAFPVGTPTPRKNALKLGLVLHGNLAAVAYKALRALVPEPTPPSDFERLQGAQGETLGAAEARRALERKTLTDLIAAIVARVNEGTWGNASPTQQQALTDAMAQVDLMASAQNAPLGPPPGPASPRAPGAGTDATDCEPRTPDESACGRHPRPDRTARVSRGGCP